jgi:hypothetical protein
LRCNVYSTLFLKFLLRLYSAQEKSSEIYEICSQTQGRDRKFNNENIFMKVQTGRS